MQVQTKSPLFSNSVIFLLLMALLMIVAPMLLQGDYFSTKLFDPHGHCFLWKPELLWAFASTDMMIGLSYLAISSVLVYVVQRVRKDIPFDWMVLSFGAFIFTCGMTHFLKIWNLWHTDYWVAVSVNIVCGVASVATALLLPPLVPKFFRVLEAAKLSNQRKEQLEIINIRLQEEIAERKRAEEEVRKLNLELEERLIERAAQIEQLARLNEDLESFSYTVSHDLRAPARVIDGFTQVLVEDYGDKLDAEAHDLLGRIQNESIRMGQIIDAVLMLARISRREMEHQAVNLSELAQKTIDSLRQNQPKREVTVTIEPDLMVEGDVGLLRLVTENLLSNAWKFTAHTPDAKITVGSTEQDGSRVYFVRDNGAGFEMEYAGKLFGAFQRLHKPTEFEGTGVGLATVRRIIQRHGGDIRAEAAPNQGATFYFTLPETGKAQL